MLNVQNAIKIFGTETFLIGRYYAHGDYWLGRVAIANGKYGYLSDDGSMEATEGFEILTCYYAQNCSK